MTFAGMFLTFCVIGGTGGDEDQQNPEDIIEKSATVYAEGAKAYCGDFIKFMGRITFPLTDLEILEMGDNHSLTVSYCFGITGEGCYDGGSHSGQGNGYLTKCPYLQITWQEREVGIWPFRYNELVEGSLSLYYGLETTEAHACDGPVEVPGTD